MIFSKVSLIARLKCSPRPGRIKEMRHQLDSAACTQHQWFIRNIQEALEALISYPNSPQPSPPAHAALLWLGNAARYECDAPFPLANQTALDQRALTFGFIRHLREVLKRNICFRFRPKYLFQAISSAHDRLPGPREMNPSLMTSAEVASLRV